MQTDVHMDSEGVPKRQSGPNRLGWSTLVIISLQAERQTQRTLGNTTSLVANPAELLSFLQSYELWSEAQIVWKRWRFHEAAEQQRLNRPPSGLTQFDRGSRSEDTQITKPSITEEKVKACLCFCSRRVTQITLLWWAAVSAALISARCIWFCPLSYLNDSHASLSKHSEQTGRAVLKTWHRDMFIL